MQKAFATRRQGGFTLIEIMVVVVILGILAAFVVPNIMSKPDEARIVKAKQDIRALESALSMYKLDNFYYPSSQQGLEALVTKPSGEPEPRNYNSGGYIKSLPKDPWGNPYQYLSPGTHNADFDIFSLGTDNRPGGEGSAADVGNWETAKQ
ncbi:type II secretion system protein GspG [Solimonas sp. K1W22B-7]|uniref:type II secretion system major pseudopilin GspG n=1 Tax=Solimonas sp. K1W22B-7 TaxID=2303331 RepID=UPI000E335573|nr:type II secretion system major pseudopilin GspG [Solimonas sp. K1W22B-7]AXQ29441.1 type II secretion system protein GspG [Solimonas sp. K1W22B-7]